jgi:LuxR family maltose regulon positive regulatory protein
LPILAGYLRNDFEELEERIVLVLDDYHLVNNPVVHELLNYVLRHPPERLQNQGRSLS